MEKDVKIAAYCLLYIIKKYEKIIIFSGHIDHTDHHPWNLKTLRTSVQAHSRLNLHPSHFDRYATIQIKTSILWHPVMRKNQEFGLRFVSVPVGAG